MTKTNTQAEAMMALRTAMFEALSAAHAAGRAGWYDNDAAIKAEAAAGEMWDAWWTIGTALDVREQLHELCIAERRAWLDAQP